MVYAGIDYSINCPCVCIYNDDDGKFNHDNCTYFFQQNNVSKKEIERRNNLNLKNIRCSNQYKWKNNYARYLALADYFISILIQYDVSVVAMEDYALNGSGKVFNIAECTYTIKNLMFLCGIKVYTYPPTYVKRIFTTKGNADKDLMCSCYTMRYNVNIPNMFECDNTDSPVSDIIDSHAMLYAYFNGDLAYD